MSDVVTGADIAATAVTSAGPKDRTQRAFLVAIVLGPPASLLAADLATLPRQLNVAPWLVAVLVHLVAWGPLLGVFTVRAVSWRPFRPTTFRVPVLALLLSITLDVAAYEVPEAWTTGITVRAHFALERPDPEDSPQRVFMNPGIVDGAGYFVHTDEVDASGFGTFRHRRRWITAPVGYAVHPRIESWDIGPVTYGLGDGWWFVTSEN